MRIDAVLLNAGPPSKVSRAETNQDIRAILDQLEPNFALGCETVGDGPLPERKRQYPTKIRNTKTAGRANLWGYVDEKVEVTWTDLKEKFPRAEHPHLGPHPARAYYRFDYHSAQVLDAHMPPGWPGAGPAREENLDSLAARMAPWTTDRWQHMNSDQKQFAKSRARMLFWDSNMSPVALHEFAARVDGWVIGDEIDCVVVRNVKFLWKDYTRSAGNHRVHTDHPHGLLRVKLQFDPID